MQKHRTTIKTHALIGEKTSISKTRLIAAGHV